MGQLLWTEPSPESCTPSAVYSLSLYSKMCLSAHKDAHSALHHHPSKKRARGHAGMPEMGLILAALGTGTSLC